jgi:hypothetical protein
MGRQVEVSRMSVFVEARGWIHHHFEDMLAFCILVYYVSGVIDKTVEEKDMGK